MNQKIKKILIFNLNGRGGMIHYSSQFVNSLEKTHEVHVVLPSYSESGLYKNQENIFRIRTNPSLVSFLFDSLNVIAHIRLLLKIKKFAPDVIHFMDNHPWYIPYSILGKLFGAKIYVTQHDPFPHSGENAGLFHKVAILVNAHLRKMAQVLIVHEESMREKVIREYHIPREKIISIPHGAYNFLERNQKIQRERTTFLFFGRIVEYKGLDILLDSIKLLRKDSKNPFKLIIAGEGDISPYKEKIEELGDVIELYNRYISDDEIRDFFSRASFVVLPYRDATASGVIPLAYSFSLPVIATDVGVLGNYVIDASTGFLIKKENPIELKEKIKVLLEDTELSLELGKNAFEFQKNHLSWEAIVGKIYPN